MTQPYEIVLADGGENPSAGADDVLEVRPMPRWVRVGGAVLAAALLVGALLAHQHHGGGPTAQPVPSIAPSLVPHPVADIARPPDDTVASAQGSWVLENDAVLVVRDGKVQRREAVTGLSTAEGAGRPRLVLDADAERLWVVVEQGMDAWLAEYDATTLRLLRTVRWSTPVGAAAALDGHVYLSTARGVFDLAPGAGRPRLVLGLSGAVGAIAADPGRHRLVLIDLGFPTSAWTYVPGRSPREADQTLRLQEGTLAIAHGAVWVAGQVATGSVLERLDPVTLQPVAVSALSSRLDADAALVGSGTRSVWVRDGVAGLTCADAGTGRVLQTWDVPSAASVASAGNGAVVARGTGFAVLPLAGCRG